MYANVKTAQSYPPRRRRPRYQKRKGLVLPNPLLLLLPLAVIGIILSQSASQESAAGESKTLSQQIDLFFDREDPVITGIHSLYTYEGDDLDYLHNIKATDDQDASPVLTLDSSQVNIQQAGTYEVIYIAEDASGNKTKVTAPVTVMLKPENYVSTATIYAAIDEELAKIILSNMTPAEQVQSIYQWTRSHLMYSGSSQHEDWHQAGYQMLTTGFGDCYGYYAVTKLMLERLGIPNMDVRKVKNSEKDSNHFWSLVSVDGGETYYHLDTTPRVGEGDHFLLVCDSFLDDYSKTHGYSHNRDMSLYPATPEENYGE